MEERSAILWRCPLSPSQHPKPASQARILRDNCGRISSELLTASPWIASCMRALPASPPLATLEKRRGSLRRCLSLPGSKEAGKAARPAIGLRRVLAPLGDAGSRVNAAPRSWKIARRPGLEHEEDGPMTMAVGPWPTVHLSRNPPSPLILPNTRQRRSRPTRGPIWHCSG
ncbi:hypothetical protein M440DRAFT_1078031 [Trichoderma longibrachiatum ATCC 18648]|uniref:Uncharacterized protein n=1 Tax=Trichoderma longibrachiatum ATCC 18648 TaxID=983965 RepID=A0A2T4BVE7_TRILO|nr:hypothetical protein M440DRAFT_1078031 [Trichoderma longibrachiatum ATCC 18648]